MINIIDTYNQSNIDEIWQHKGALSTNKEHIHHKILDILKDYNFYEFNKFCNINEFVKYINDFIINNNIESNYKDSSNQIKGFIFESFCQVFLNYFSTLDILVKDKRIAPRYTFKYCIPTPIEYCDYGVDLLCRITDSTGVSKNAVIQVKYRLDKDAPLEANIMQKLYADGTYFKFIDPFTIDDKSQPLVLFTNADFNKYRPTFQKHPMYHNTVIIDCNSIDLVVNNDDFWDEYKKYMKKI